MKKALITGIAGQDGSYLAELLLDKGYEVHGLLRRSPDGGANATWRIQHILEKLILHWGDVSDRIVAPNLIQEVLPDEIYHLATKHDEPSINIETYLENERTNVNSTLYLLEAIKNLKPACRFFYASTSKIFGTAEESPQNEETPIQPNSLYGISKAAGLELVRLYRDRENIFACSGILYNHESPRRDFFFLPRKITSAVAKIKLGLQNKLTLGDLGARRDWGFAGDFAEAIWLMLQAERPEDYVIGTGEIHSVKDVLDIAFGSLGLDWKTYVEVDQKLVRKPEKFAMVADISKIKKKLNWEPKTKFEKLIKMMVQEDLRLG